ncbi:hypothetical protein [Aeromicrobium sp.]|uniref:hypothetical protein n=1 Tax=Aeromicrobium sp. TaxID=1871063 RepID=UPI0030C5D034
MLIPLVPPYLFWSRGSGQATAVIGAHDGAAVLMAPAQGHVTRTYAMPVFDAEYEARRRVFAKHVRSPLFEVLDNGTTLREEFVAGCYFFDLPLGARLQVTRNMIAGYESLTHAEGSGGSQSLMRPVLEALGQASPPDDLAALLQESLTPRAVRRWPRIPSATDPRPKNSVILGDLTPVAIDLGSLRLDPFFYYPVGFVAHAGRGVRDAFLEGELDADFERLFTAAGARYRANEQGRLGLLALRTLIASYKECSPGDVFNVPRFNWVVRRRWGMTLAP